MGSVRAVTRAALFSVVVLGGLSVPRGVAQGPAKAPVYFIVENEVLDLPNYLKEYVPRAREMIKANGGRYIAAGDATTFAGEPPKSRVAIFVFDDMQQIQAWLNSAEYRELKEIGDKYARFRNYAVPGVPQ